MKRIELTRGYFTIVDNDDYDTLINHSWSYNSSGYAHSRIRINGKSRMILMHRLILDIINNPEITTDHINRNRLDNRKSNLRKCNRSQSCANRGNFGKSEYRGVVKRKNYNKWRVRLRKNGKAIHVGDFDNPVDAAKAYDKKAIEVHGEFAALNFPRTSSAEY